MVTVSARTPQVDRVDQREGCNTMRNTSAATTLGCGTDQTPASARSPRKLPVLRPVRASSAGCGAPDAGIDRVCGRKRPLIADGNVPDAQAGVEDSGRSPSGVPPYSTDVDIRNVHAIQHAKVSLRDHAASVNMQRCRPPLPGQSRRGFAAVPPCCARSCPGAHAARAASAINSASSPPRIASRVWSAVDMALGWRS